MKIKIHHLAAALLVSAFSLQPSALHAQGALTPPGAPAPTMKTLAQIEARTPISGAPFNIATSGSYYLTTNLTVSGGDAITIAASSVTLDLNGFTITSTASSATGNGILINNGLRNLSILNGFIQGGVTNNGSGVYSGSGFGYGIYNYPVQNVRVSGVSISGCLYDGINLGTGDSTLVESCTVRTVGGRGIFAGTIKSSVAKDCGNTAIYGNQVSDCRGECPGYGYGVYAITAQNCQGSSSSDYGLNANTAQNCYGSSTSTHGVVANSALNCQGVSFSGTGLNAFTAENCYGASTSGVGLNANLAQNCQGSSSSSTGLNAKITLTCYGTTISGVGLNAYLANSSYGESTGGGLSPVGLIANTANSCYGSSSGFFGLQAVNANFCFGSIVAVTGFKTNMP